MKRTFFFVLVFVSGLLVAACAGDGGEGVCDAGTCPALADVSCPSGRDVACPAAPDVVCPGCQDVVCPGCPDAGCPAAPDVVCPSCPDVWAADTWTADGGDEPDAGVIPEALPPGIQTYFVSEGDYVLNPHAEPGNAIARIITGAVVYYREGNRLDRDGEPVGHRLPAAQGITPLEGSCCAPYMGPDHDFDGYCDRTTAYWDEWTWAALGFSLGSTPHRFVYAFWPLDDEDDLFEVEARTWVRCDADPAWADCNHVYRVTVPRGTEEGEIAWQDDAIRVEHSVEGDCPEGAPSSLGTQISPFEWRPSAWDDGPPATVESLVPNWEEVRDNLAYLAERLADVYAASGPDCQFPANQGVTPLEGTCCASLGGPDTNGDGLCDGSDVYFDEPSWNALDFNPGPAHAFTYGLRVEDGTMTVRAYADQDCDNIQSTFMRFVRPVPSAGGCTVEVVPGFYSEQETE